MNALTQKENFELRNKRVVELEAKLERRSSKFIKVCRIQYASVSDKLKNEKLATAASFLEAIVQIMEDDNIPVSRWQFFEDLENILTKWRISYLPCSSKRLREKVVAFKSQKDLDTETLIKLPRIGNKNAFKVELEIRAWIIVMRSSGNNYTDAFITRHLKEICELTGKNIPSDSWFAKILASHEVKTITASGRFSKMGRGMHIYKGYNPIERPIYAGDAWQCDGSRVNLTPWLEKGVSHFLYTVVVRDVMSGTILGVNFGEYENHAMYVRALRMAVARTEYLPYELILDKFPGSNSEQWKGVESLLDKEGVKLNYTSVATGKAQVERWFETVQNVFMMKSQLYYGEGIKSTRLAAHRSDKQLQLIKKLAKSIEWDYDKAVREAEMILHAYNHTAVNKYSRKFKNISKSPEQMHESSDKPHVIKLENKWKAMRLFGLQKTVSIRHQMIRTEIEKIEYLYAVNETNVWLHHKQVLMCYDMENTDKVWLFTADGTKFLCECEQIERAMIFGPNADWATLTKSKERLKNIEREKARVLNEMVGNVTQNDLALLSPAYTPKAQLEEAETAYLMAENKKGGVIEILNTEADDDDLAPHSAMGTIEDFDVDAYLYSQM